VDGRAVFPPDGVLGFVTVAFYPTELSTADVVTYGYPEVRLVVRAPYVVFSQLLVRHASRLLRTALALIFCVPSSTSK